MNKILLITLFLFLLVGSLLTFNLINNQKDKIEVKDQLYQGPVQEGYNEQLFRETGIYEKESER